MKIAANKFFKDLEDRGEIETAQSIMDSVIDYVISQNPNVHGTRSDWRSLILNDYMVELDSRGGWNHYFFIPM